MRTRMHMDSRAGSGNLGGRNVGGGYLGSRNVGLGYLGSRNVGVGNLGGGNLGDRNEDNKAALARNLSGGNEDVRAGKWGRNEDRMAGCGGIGGNGDTIGRSLGGSNLQGGNVRTRNVGGRNDDGNLVGRSMGGGNLGNRNAGDRNEDLIAGLAGNVGDGTEDSFAARVRNVGARNKDSSAGNVWGENGDTTVGYAGVGNEDRTITDLVSEEHSEVEDELVSEDDSDLEEIIDLISEGDSDLEETEACLVSEDDTKVEDIEASNTATNSRALHENTEKLLKLKLDMMKNLRIPKDIIDVVNPEETLLKPKSIGNEGSFAAKNVGSRNVDTLAARAENVNGGNEDSLAERVEVLRIFGGGGKGRGRNAMGGNEEGGNRGGAGSANVRGGRMVELSDSGRDMQVIVRGGYEGVETGTGLANVGGVNEVGGSNSAGGVETVGAKKRVKSRRRYRVGSSKSEPTSSHPQDSGNSAPNTTGAESTSLGKVNKKKIKKGVFKTNVSDRMSRWRENDVEGVEDKAEGDDGGKVEEGKITDKEASTSQTATSSGVLHESNSTVKLMKLKLDMMKNLRISKENIDVKNEGTPLSNLKPDSEDHKQSTKLKNTRVVNLSSFSGQIIRKPNVPTPEMQPVSVMRRPKHLTTTLDDIKATANAAPEYPEMRKLGMFSDLKLQEVKREIPKEDTGRLALMKRKLKGATLRIPEHLSVKETAQQMSSESDSTNEYTSLRRPNIFASTKTAKTADPNFNKETEVNNNNLEVVYKPLRQPDVSNRGTDSKEKENLPNEAQSIVQFTSHSMLMKYKLETYQKLNRFTS